MKSKVHPHPGGENREQFFYKAVYRDHPLPEYNSNPLIRALPPLPDHLTLQAALTKLPDYGPNERTLPRNLKLQRLAKLGRFFVGLPRVANLFETLYVMICEGYVGRMPNSLEDNELRQRLYERQQKEEFFEIEDVENGAENSVALVGIPGGGKSEALKHASKPFRRVIYHEDLNLYQIPALLAEMPYKGASINTLAHAIIRALDKAVPQCNYYQTYLCGRENAELLFMDAVALMQTHKVGILLIDESQNREYRDTPVARKRSGQTPLSTLLITATNSSQIPLMMCGTPELFDSSGLGSRMSMLRRNVGHGLDLWRPLSLPKTDTNGEVTLGEFDVVVQLLWEYQWTKTPFELTQRVRNIFYYYSQGIPDVIVKLFHGIQLRAVRGGGDEVVDEALIHDVARNELKALTDVTRAIREQDYRRTGQMADLAAFLQADPHELTLQRLEAQEGLFPQTAEDLDDEDVDPSLLPPTEEACAEPEEVPTGSAAKKPRKRRVKTTMTAPAREAPAVRPVDDIGDVFGD